MEWFGLLFFAFFRCLFKWKTVVCKMVHKDCFGLQTRGVPVPSASSKIIFTMFNFFWACSIFFEHSQIFWSWSKAKFYLINLHIWACSKIFEHIQKILNTVKNIWTWSKNIWTSRWIRHKHQSFDPSLLAYKWWLIFMGMKRISLENCSAFDSIQKTEIFNSPISNLFWKKNPRIHPWVSTINWC